ncbi:MAG TPA: hypothetical protein PLI89_12025 [Chitinophagales bacterium]|nr:hypothetical protein [Chitinophagales bacterium]
MAKQKETLRTLYRAMKKDTEFQRLMKSKYPGYQKPGMWTPPGIRHTYSSIYFGYLLGREKINDLKEKQNSNEQTKH